MPGGMDESLPLPAIADLFHVSTKTVRRWIKQEGFPKPFYIGQTPFFKAWEVQIWHKQQQQNESPVAPEKGKRRGASVENQGQTGTR